MAIKNQLGRSANRERCDLYISDESDESENLSGGEGEKEI